MISSEKISEQDSQIKTPAVGERADVRPTRDWARLFLIHINVAAAAPFVAATFYTIISPDRTMLLTWHGLIGYTALVGCTYIFFGIFAIAAVILISPVLAVFSKLTAPGLGRLLAIVVSGILAWAIGSLSDVPAFQVAAVATAALASAKIEHAWRTTRLNG